jgi:hypothetical protein
MISTNLPPTDMCLSFEVLSFFFGLSSIIFQPLSCSLVEEPAVIHWQQSNPFARNGRKQNSTDTDDHFVNTCIDIQITV